MFKLKSNSCSRLTHWSINYNHSNIIRIIYYLTKIFKLAKEAIPTIITKSEVNNKVNWIK